MNLMFMWWGGKRKPLHMIRCAHDLWAVNTSAMYPDTTQGSSHGHVERSHLSFTQHPKPTELQSTRPVYLELT